MFRLLFLTNPFSGFRSWPWRNNIVALLFAVAAFVVIAKIGLWYALGL